jgi:hypothetical protein
VVSGSETPPSGGNPRPIPFKEVDSRL